MATKKKAAKRITRQPGRPLLNPLLMAALTSDSAEDRGAAVNVLSALRGPDRYEDDPLKERYTAYIRGWLFAPAYSEALGLMMVRREPAGAAELQALIDGIERDRAKWDGGAHFSSHLLYALMGMARLDPKYKSARRRPSE